MNIVLVGTMGSGKDTIVNELVENQGLVPVKLGKYIRKHVDEMLSHIPYDKRRTYYQQYGEGMRELFGEFFWNEIAYQSVNKRFDGQHFIITDARQPHDIQFWMGKGFTLVCVETSDENRKIRLSARDGKNFDESTLEHYTELRAKEIINQVKEGILSGYIINNDGILERTIEQCEQVMNSMA